MVMQKKIVMLCAAICVYMAGVSFGQGIPGYADYIQQQQPVVQQPVIVNPPPIYQNPQSQYAAQFQPQVPQNWLQYGYKEEYRQIHEVRPIQPDLQPQYQQYYTPQQQWTAPTYYQPQQCQPFWCPSRGCWMYR